MANGERWSRWFVVRYGFECDSCARDVLPGDQARYHTSRFGDDLVCSECGTEGDGPEIDDDEEVIA